MTTAQVNVNLEFRIEGVTVPIAASALPAYTEASAGNIGVPDGTADATAFVIPFGTIAAACLLFVKNNNTVDVGVRLNGAVANSYRLAPGGFVLIAQPVAAGGTPIASVSVVTVGAQVDAAAVSYVVLGT